MLLRTRPAACLGAAALATGGLGGDDDLRGNQGNDHLDGGPHAVGDFGNGGLGVDTCVLVEFPVSC